MAVLPHRDATQTAFRAIADKIGEFEGQATLVTDVRLDPERAAAIERGAQDERAAEYAELTREAERFIEHVRRERAHREFTYPEVASLDADLRKLRHWAAQIRARDYFDSAGGPVGASPMDALLDHCQEMLSVFVEEASAAASRHDEAPM